MTVNTDERAYIERPLEKRIAALESQLAERGRTCEHCGGTRFWNGPPECPRCGAPQCCQTCCRITALEMRIDALLGKVEG